MKQWFNRYVLPAENFIQIGSDIKTDVLSQRTLNPIKRGLVRLGDLSQHKEYVIKTRDVKFSVILFAAYATVHRYPASALYVYHTRTRTQNKKNEYTIAHSYTIHDHTYIRTHHIRILIYYIMYIATSVGRSLRG